ncbi:MAG TPA: hypothetical protein VMT54_20475 [Candidatus Cybelea sp.]|nr:hypothetical protein [Candidatus Cybelea sp.]
MARALLSGAGLLALLLASAPVSADDLVKETTSSEISVKPVEGGYETTTVNRRYETDVFGEADAGPKAVAYEMLLIEETHVNKEGPEIDGERVSAHVKVTAFPLGATGKGEAKFTIDADGDEAKVDASYLTVTRWGCCVEQPTYAVFSLESGAYLFNATGRGESGDWVTLGAHGGFHNERIIAFHAAPTSADDIVLKGADNAAIVITYASDTHPLQRVLVTVPKDVMGSDDMINWLPKPMLISKTEPKGTDRVFIDKDGDPKELFTNVIYRLTLDAKTKIEIPVVNDQLKLDGAKLPKGFALVPVQL